MVFWGLAYLFPKFFTRLLSLVLLHVTAIPFFMVFNAGHGDQAQRLLTKVWIVANGVFLAPSLWRMTYFKFMWYFNRVGTENLPLYSAVTVYTGVMWVALVVFKVTLRSRYNRRSSRLFGFIVMVMFAAVAIFHLGPFMVSVFIFMGFSAYLHA
mgnify:CR=1 FL=1